MDKRKNGQQSQNSFYLRQNEFAQKSITLQVLHDQVKVNKELCEGRTDLLRKETQTLDEIHSKVWQLQNNICHRIWNFSTKHDFSEVVLKYPDFSSDFNVFCECGRSIKETSEENVETDKLEFEIRTLESNLKNARFAPLEKELIIVQKELQMCENESPENESLKTEIKACEERIFSLRSKIGAECKKMEKTNISSELLKNSSFLLKTSSSNLKKINTSAPLLLAPQPNLDESKENCSLSRSSIPDGGGFVRASTYSSTIEKAMPLQKTASFKTNIIGAITTEKLTPVTNIAKKKFVAKTKSLITQRR